MNNNTPCLIRPATEDDASLLHLLVHELAEYEHLTHEVTSTPDSFHTYFFGPHPCASALLAFFGDHPAGFAVWFPTFSTFAGHPGAFLEDLYVRPEFRRRGVGRTLLEAFTDSAKEAGCQRLEWRALSWNTPALDFYKSIGATILNDWVTLRKKLL
jgi:GNAT superfamily N-acetyltransferase